MTPVSGKSGHGQRGLAKHPALPTLDPRIVRRGVRPVAQPARSARTARRERCRSGPPRRLSGPNPSRDGEPHGGVRRRTLLVHRRQQRLRRGLPIGLPPLAAAQADAEVAQRLGRVGFRQGDAIRVTAATGTDPRTARGATCHRSPRRAGSSTATPRWRPCRTGWRRASRTVALRPGVRPWPGRRRGTRPRHRPDRAPCACDSRVMPGNPARRVERPVRR